MTWGAVPPVVESETVLAHVSAVTLKHHVLWWEALCFLFSSRRTAAAAVGDLWPRLWQLWTELRRHIGSRLPRQAPPPAIPGSHLSSTRRGGSKITTAGIQTANQQLEKRQRPPGCAVTHWTESCWPQKVLQLNSTVQRPWTEKVQCVKSPTLCFYFLFV